MAMVPSRFTLVKYDEPILKQSCDSASAPDKLTPSHSVEDEFQEFLDKILPPREFEDDGQIWIQHVSSEPVKRIDVIKVKEQLHRMMTKRQAQKTGICRIRRELYNQCFDELIRQVAIDCPERGLLLLRVRDEWRMTLDIYEELCKSSVAFGMRKARLAELVETDIDNTIETLRKEHQELQNLVDDLTSKCNIIEKRANEQRALEVKKQTEEIQYMKKLNQQLKNQIEGITSSKFRLESS